MSDSNAVAEESTAAAAPAIDDDDYESGEEREESPAPAASPVKSGSNADTTANSASGAGMPAGSQPSGALGVPGTENSDALSWSRDGGDGEAVDGQTGGEPSEPESHRPIEVCFPLVCCLSHRSS
jgi:hypothetical protein